MTDLYKEYINIKTKYLTLKYDQHGGDTMWDKVRGMFPEKVLRENLEKCASILTQFVNIISRDYPNAKLDEDGDCETGCNAYSLIDKIHLWNGTGNNTGNHQITKRYRELLNNNLDWLQNDINIRNLHKWDIVQNSTNSGSVIRLMRVLKNLVTINTNFDDIPLDISKDLKYENVMEMLGKFDIGHNQEHLMWVLKNLDTIWYHFNKIPLNISKDIQNADIMNMLYLIHYTKRKNTKYKDPVLHALYNFFNQNSLLRVVQWKRLPFRLIPNELMIKRKIHKSSPLLDDEYEHEKAKRDVINRVSGRRRDSLVEPVFTGRRLQSSSRKR